MEELVQALRAGQATPDQQRAAADHIEEQMEDFKQALLDWCVRWERDGAVPTPEALQRRG